MAEESDPGACAATLTSRPRSALPGAPNGQGHFCLECDGPVSEPTCPRHGAPALPLRCNAEADAHGPGLVVGQRYRIEGRVGSGGMGTVYVARQLGIGREVALKVLRPDLISDLVAVRRFYREARAVGLLGHPNIVRMFDFGIDPASGVTFLVLELVRGVTLRAVLESDGPLGERRAAGLLAQAAAGLVEAHAKGLVHRDLKPENLMIERLPSGSEHLRILDFGVVKIVCGELEGSARLTAAGSAVGTPCYMSPEQAVGDAVDFRADLYALGCILHEALTGAVVFDGDSFERIASRHLTEAPPALPKVLADGAPPSNALRDLHAMLLGKSRDSRPSTTALVAAALSALASASA